MNISPIFSCFVCDHSWSRKYDYEKHLNTKKHEKNEKNSREKRKGSLGKRKMAAKNSFDITKNKILLVNQSEKKTETRYCCDYCKFTTTIKKEAEKHRKSKPHIRNENIEEEFLEITNKYVCLSCDRSYDKYDSCWKHSKTCKIKPENVAIGKINEEFAQEENSSVLRTNEVFFSDIAQVKSSDIEFVKKEIYKEVYESVVGKILENNQTMMEKMAETMIQSQQAMIQTTNNSNNNTIIQNNTTNNHCTINMFLNDKCKDAVNITDWVNNLVLDFEQLYYNSENGFQKGLTKMLIDNLKLYNVCKRPIHFTDIKRDTMYIKDADEWTKHDNNEKLLEVLETGARQGIQCFAEWMEENTPAYHDLDSQLGKQYMAIHQTVIRPQTERMKAYPKVMKEVARAVQLRKEDQLDI